MLMAISTAQHILSLDENVLAVCLMNCDFRAVELASKVRFGKRFKVSEKLRKEFGDYAAVIFATAQISSETFGNVKRVIVDYESAKTMLIPISEVGYVGLVVHSSANADYIALKIESFLDEKRDVEDYC